MLVVVLNKGGRDLIDKCKFDSWGVRACDKVYWICNDDGVFPSYSSCC